MSLSLRCSGRNGQCASPVAKVEDGYLSILHIHHGERHITRVSLPELRDLLARASDSGIVVTR